MRALSILFICLPLSLFAQKDTTAKQLPIKQHELALNFTFLVKQVIDFGNTSFPISPYGLSYKYMGAKNHGVRTGLGISYSSSSELHDDPDLTDRKFSSMSTNLRVGYEYRVVLGRSWSLFTGFDVICDVASTKSKTESTFQIADLKTNKFAFGGGPVLGIQVHFNKRISLFTESTLFFTTGKEKSTDKFTSVANPDFSSEEVTTTQLSKLNFVLPTSIYLAVRLFKS